MPVDPVQIMEILKESSGRESMPVDREKIIELLKESFRREGVGRYGSVDSVSVRNSRNDLEPNIGQTRIDHDLFDSSCRVYVQSNKFEDVPIHIPHTFTLPDSKTVPQFSYLGLTLDLSFLA